MWPTSIAVWKPSAPPHFGQVSPSRAWRRSANSDWKSRPVWTPRRWRPSRFAPATNCPSRSASSATTSKSTPTGPSEPPLPPQGGRVSSPVAGGTAARAEGGADLVVGRRANRRVQGARDLALVEPVVPADEREYQGAVGF